MAIFSTNRILFLIVFSLWSTTLVAQTPGHNFPPFDDLVAKRGLPDPFMMDDGRRVSTLEDWEKQRIYIKDMLLYYQYGYYPPTPQNLKVEIKSSKTILDGRATETRLVLSMGPGHSVTLRVDLSVPTVGAAPFPVVITGDREWGRTEGLEVATDRGYIVADFYRTDLDPDNDDRTNGVHPIYPDYDWATISAWAWGFSRVVDYLQTRKDVDQEKIVATGHSRGGKTALLAGAMDERIAVVAPNGSGAGGCGSFKYMQGGAESLMRITRDDRFHYWFQPRLSEFKRRVDRLPFDQHFLKALVAPRALLCTDGLHDEWANPWGGQQTTEAAREVYKFLGVPEMIGHHYRQGGHHHNEEDWTALLDFADYNFFGKPLPGGFYKENFDRVDSLINGKPPAPAQTSPNIIFIITDDQGWTQVSYPSDPARADSASDFIETPNMATLASEGMRFSQAYTPNPICAPARHSMLFGQNATRHIYNQDETWIDRAPDWLTIPKALKAANPEYRTAHFGKWHVGVKPELAGFDFTDGLTDNEEGDSAAGEIFAEINFIDQKQMDAYNEANGIDTTPANPKGRDRSVTFYTHEDPKTAFSLTARASAFIREAVADGKPFYAHIAHYAIHSALAAREESFARFQAKPAGQKHDGAGFAAMTFDMDESIGQVMQLVEELGIGDNTYIVLISDNGGVEYVAQTSRIDAEANILSTHRTRIAANNAPLRGGKHSFYEGGLRVPFIIAGPNIPANSHSNEPITGLDMLPTFADLAGFEGSFQGPLDGDSLVALFDGSNETVFERKDPTLVFHQAGRRPGRSAVREGRYKLVKDWERRSEVDGETLPFTLALYDLEADIGELNDLSAVHPDIVSGLHDKLLQHIAAVNGEFEDNPRKDPMSVLQERAGLGKNRSEQVKNRQPVVVEYVSPFKDN